MSTEVHRLSGPARFGIAIGAPLVAAGLTSAVWQWVQPAVSLLFFPAVTLSALLGGVGAGLLATFVSSVLCALFYLPPVYSMSVGFDDFVRLLVFASAATVTASLSSARYRAEARLRAANEDLERALASLRGLGTELEQRVEDRTRELAHANSVLQTEVRERARLSERLVHVQEEEKRRLSRELHDHVGQLLSALKLTLDAMLKGPTAPRQSMQYAVELLETLMGQMRQLSLDLRPTLLDDLGLVPALLWHIERFSTLTGIKVVLTQSGFDTRLDATIETAAFRVVQEALTNVARHAGVTNVSVWVRRDDTDVSVIVEDSGRGFDMLAPAPPQSSGLSGLEERVRLVGGQFSLESAPGTGTRVSAVFPLPAEVAVRS